MTTLYHGDCLVEMQKIADKSVDAIIADLPYGVLSRSNEHAKWDNIIPMEPLWEQYRRIIKDNGAIILFSQGMFTAQLMTAAPDLWRYNMVWDKVNRPTGFLDCNRRPLRIHEDICVFYKSQPVYNPQMTKGRQCHKRGNSGNAGGKGINRDYGNFKITPTVLTDEKYPLSIIPIEKEHNGNQSHGTQKPVALMGYLINTYTNRGGVVLDNTMGSGSTGVACVNTGRNFIGIELNDEYFQIASDRISKAEQEMAERLF